MKLNEPLDTARMPGVPTEETLFYEQVDKGGVESRPMFLKGNGTVH